MASPSIPTLSAHGADMPAIGFGTSSLGDCGEIVASALRVGYRHIDTAWKYGTERGVGEGIRVSGVPRNEPCVRGSEAMSRWSCRLMPSMMNTVAPAICG
jgi:diketogulonate reductase-like aldo/keto reductase